MPGLFVNSVYAADMTVDELTEKLNAAEEIPDLEIVERDGSTHKVPLAVIGYHADYHEPVAALKKKQSVRGLLN